MDVMVYSPRPPPLPPPCGTGYPSASAASYPPTVWASSGSPLGLEASGPCIWGGGGGGGGGENAQRTTIYIIYYVYVCVCTSMCVCVWVVQD